MQTTPNLGLKMPAQEDFYNIEDHNNNSRIIDSKYKELSDLIGAIKSELLDATYPVGSIYMSVNKTDPGTLFGGKWQKLPAGRCLIGAGSYTPTSTSTGDASTTYTAGAQGGQRQRYVTSSCLPSHTHHITEDLMGSHIHTIPICENINPTSVNVNNPSVFLSGCNYTTTTSRGWQSSIMTDNPSIAPGHNIYMCRTDALGQHRHNVRCATTGSDNAMPVQSPYLVVNMWQRTA